MKLFWTGDNDVSVDLHKPDKAQLGNARAIGEMLTKVELCRPEGEALVDAVDAILKKFSDEAESDKPDGEEEDGDE